MEYEIVETSMHLPSHAQIMRAVTSDLELMAQIWADAESRMEDHPHKVWWWAVDVDGTPLAWCAAQPIAEDKRRVMKCTDNYERPGPGRELGLYQEVFLARHIALGHMACVTVIFDQPVTLHLEHGWELADNEGFNDRGQHWQEMRRN